MQNIIDKLKDNLQIIYRRGLDADKTLATLQQQGKGKFQYVFAEDAGFNVKSKRFQPYIEELAKDIIQLEQSDEKQQPNLLPNIVKKIELLFATLSQLQDSLKS